MTPESLESVNAKVQAAVPEPVVACGRLEPAGTWGAFGAGRISGVDGLLRQRSANKKAGQLSTRGAMFKGNRQTMFAFTEDKLYVLETKFSGYSGIKVLGTLVVWDRSDLKIQTIPGKLATKVIIDHTDGEHYELEATTVAARGYQDALLNGSPSSRPDRTLGSRPHAHINSSVQACNSSIACSLPGATGRHHPVSTRISRPGPRNAVTASCSPNPKSTVASDS